MIIRSKSTSLAVARMLRWENVNLHDGIIGFVPRKTIRTSHMKVSLPNHPNLLDCLKEAQSWRKNAKDPHAYILPDVANRFKRNPTGIRKDVQKISAIATGLTVINKNVRSQRKLAASAYSLHSFRHTFVSFCANAGVSLDIVAEIVGHGSPMMTRHYAHFSNAAKSAILNALPSQSAKTPATNESIDGQKLEKREELMKMLEGLDPEEIQSLLKAAQKRKGSKSQE